MVKKELSAQRKENTTKPAVVRRSNVTPPSLESLSATYNRIVTTNSLPEYLTTRPANQAAILQMQHLQGNAFVQKELTKPTAIQRCNGEVHAGCAYAGSSKEDDGGRNTAVSIIQRGDPPIEEESSENAHLQVDPDLIRGSIEFIRGRHRIEGAIGITNPVSLPLDVLGIDLGVDPLQLQAALTYDNRCNETLQSALMGLQAGPFVNIDEVPWQIRAGIGLRIGGMRIDPGATIFFGGTEIEGALFTLSLARASTGIPIECRPTASQTPEAPTHEPSEEPTEEPGEEPTPQAVTLPKYTLYFFYDSTLMRPESHESFQQIGELLENVPNLIVYLTGHASLEGTDAYNQRLSEIRANAVRDRLSLRGIDKSHIHTAGLGESAPAVTEPDVSERSISPAVERAREMNRRVEVSFFDPTGALEMAPLRLPEPKLRLPHTTPGR